MSAYHCHCGLHLFADPFADSLAAARQAEERQLETLKKGNVPSAPIGANGEIGKTCQRYAVDFGDGTFWSHGEDELEPA